MTTTSLPAGQGSTGPNAEPPLIHRMIMAGQLRYWIILSWAVALGTTTPWRLALAWFVGATTLGLVRTFVEKRVASRPPSADLDRIKLFITTLSCGAWAIAPLLAFYLGHEHGLAMASALLMAGYVLVFTQMRAAPREALIASSPYSAAVLIMVINLWGSQGFWTVVSMGPVLGLALVIKVVITQIKDDQLTAVNDRQSVLIDDLAMARDRANAANEAKSSFLAVVSHELRTPMNGVLGAAQLLEAGTLDPTQQTYVSIIRQSGESLLMQLNDILDLTKIETGHMVLQPVETRTSDLLVRLIGPFQAQAEAKGIGFRIVTDGARPSLIHIDPLRLAQITHNLLSNAVKFTDTGEIVVSVLRERLADDRGRFTFSVTDSGTGIADADIDQLFKPFSQVDASSTRRFGGTGLGLSICRRLARLMDGDVTVTSGAGAGSTFTLTVDVEVMDWTTKAEDGAEAPDMAPDEPTLLNLLVVEDHPVNRMIIEAWIRSIGHNCVLAENGQIGLDVAETQPFDLVIMDVNMPVMDGLTATRALRAGSSPNREVPIAVLSASARIEDHALGYAAGADAYVDKPVDFAALALVLAACPQGRAAVQALNVRRSAAA